MMKLLLRMAREAARIEVTITLALIAAALALLADQLELRASALMAAPTIGLFVNLVAALTTNRTLSAQPPLFAFHVGLAVLSLTLALDAMTSFTGHVEIASGGVFEPSKVEGEAGPWHRNELSKVQFRQKLFEIAYMPGMKRRETRSFIDVLRNGEWQTVIIGDDQPLVAPPYRFYSSFNKGFAPVLTFTDAAGVSHGGAVHMPSYPINEDRQANSFTPPGSRTPIALWLEFDKPVYDENASWTFSAPEGARLVVLTPGERRILAQGEEVNVAGGVLRYDHLTTWMGYTITANPFASLAVAAALGSLIALIWHIALKITEPIRPLVRREEIGAAPRGAVYD